MPLPVELHPDLVPFAPATTRNLSVFGIEVELVHLPARQRRPGRASNERPAFSRTPATRIMATEAIWRGDGLVVTPNRYPFASAQRLVWPEGRTRDLSADAWRAIGDWVATSGGSALVNSVGAAATIARAHAHLVPARLPFLLELAERPCRLDLVDLAADCELWQKVAPWCLLGVRGSVAGRADALVALAEARLTAAANVVVMGDTAWIMPRAVETPAPWFPYALGAAELWGRWCFLDEASFAAARAEDLERALIVAGMPPLVDHAVG